MTIPAEGRGGGSGEGRAAGSGNRRGLRAVVLVANPAAPYSRGLRVARSLAGAGYQVEIAAVAAPGLPQLEQDGPVTIRRYTAAGARGASVVERMRVAAAGEISGPPDARNVERSRARWLLARARARADRYRRWLLWPESVRGWWASLARELEPADVYHACGVNAIGAAVSLAGAARARGRAGRVLYDVVDLALDSTVFGDLPSAVRQAFRTRERAWARSADALVTVNDAIADHLAAVWPFHARPTVLLNCQPRWLPPVPRPDLIRGATGIPRGRQVVLFLGRLGRDRGLETAEEAVVRLDDAALVLLGFGPWAARLAARDLEPRLVGRHFTLPAVHPDEVPPWSASADVSLIPVPGESLNQRLSSPNKFWESLTSGTPVVVGAELSVMRSLVEAEGLGAVADTSDPDDLARALRSVLHQSPVALGAMRERCLAATRERYNWETAVLPYLDLVDSLMGGRRT